MELFSKRYGTRSIRTRISRPMSLEDNSNFLSDTARKRLQSEIKFICSSNNFLEKFLIFEDQFLKKVYLYEDILKDLSLREIGYDITKIMNSSYINFDTPEYNDTKFFDLIELILIFSKETEKQNIFDRITSILDEEMPNTSINDFMIIIKNETGLRSIIPLLKDKLLKEKLITFYESSLGRGNYENSARLSADILQFIFSSEKGQTDTKKYSENLIKDLCKKWTGKNKSNDLFNLVNLLVKNTKDFNNQISNIRHTDKHTIQVDYPDFYKLITQQNINIIELIILTFPEKYIKMPNSRLLKQNYIKKYNIDPNIGGKRDEIPDDELPF